MSFTRTSAPQPCLIPEDLSRLNAAEMYIDVDKAQFGTQTQWIAEAGVVDLFLMTGPTPSQAISPNTMRFLYICRIEGSNSTDRPFM